MPDRVPLSGPVTTENVKASPSTSLPANMSDKGVSSGVVTSVSPASVPVAIGASFTLVTPILTLAGSLNLLSASTKNVKLSLPKKLSLGV